ncbi:hypothetical protein QO010_002312 [Caulobacter ginsengisoli]|uniref:DUF1579 domain-containing protein n=1 Tax=Caulobacter ginsengisoli TaxID=400775 RepID=A0ABU0IR89_9CAUL|nr:hypothetical protein [Caulobacter ginsengisoli]MDQ0464531.1 hypothetical protein [Caulobacter ginsengisoli]
MRRVILPGLAVAVLLGCAPAPQTTTVYERYEQLKNGPALQAAAAEPARRMRELDWMVGDWRTTITVFATAASPESRETTTTSFHLVGDSILASDDLSTILTYDPFEHDWISAGFEPPMAPLNNFRARWEGRRLVAEAPARIFGETFVLRQSLIRTGQNSFEILNEQRVKGDRFVPVDRYSFTRIVKPPQPPGQ